MCVCVCMNTSSNSSTSAPRQAFPNTAANVILLTKARWHLALLKTLQGLRNSLRVKTRDLTHCKDP